MSDPKIKIYHYAKLADWQYIVDGSMYRDTAPGLAPTRPIGYADKEAYNTNAVFGLLKSQPSSWVYNPHFRSIWPRLKGNIGDMLLEIKTDPYKDNVFVADRGHIEGYLYQDKTGIPQQYLHDTQEQGERAFMKSAVPLLDYASKNPEFHYSLPEVIMPQHVPLEQISVSLQQPLLEEGLIKYPEGGTLRKEKLRFINFIEELHPWYAEYQVRSQELQMGRGAIMGEHG